MPSPQVPVSIRLTPEEYDAIQQQAPSSTTAWLRDAIREKLARAKGKPSARRRSTRPAR